MADERSNRALARIEAALARIESAARRPAPVPAASDPMTKVELDLLEAKHAKLRTVVQDSLQQLDLLIEGTKA